MTEDGSPKSEVGSRKPEAGSMKSKNKKKEESGFNTTLVEEIEIGYYKSKVNEY